MAATGGVSKTLEREVSATENGRPSWRILAPTLFLLLLAILLIIPWHPGDSPDGRDRAWALALHLGFLDELSFGKEIVFSFGPWGFLWLGYHPATYVGSLFAWAFLSFAFVESLWRISIRRASWPVSLLAVALAVLVVILKGRDTLLITLPVLWYFTGRERVLSARFFVLTIATALAALGKFSLLVLLAPLAVLLTIDETVRLRRAPLSLVALTASLLGWWFLAGQPPDDLPDFVRNGLDLAAGYGEAMTLDPSWSGSPLIQFVVASTFVVTSALFLILPILATPKAIYPWPWLDALAIAAAIFFAFKSGFVRWDDGHTAMAFGAVILLMIVCAMIFWPTDEKRRSTLLVFVLLGPLLFADSMNDGTSGRLTQSVRDVLSVVSGGWGDHSRTLGQRYDQFIERSEAMVAEFPLEGSVDVYPDLLSVVAGQPGYAPRPVPQSYAVLTTDLARLNAEHLRTSPTDQILFDIAPIDDRFPATDDSLSWPEILSRYDVVRNGASFLLLERRERPRALRIRRLAERTISAAETIAIPDTPRPIWASIRVEKTLVGHVASFLFKTPPVIMRVRTADGESTDFRLPLDLAAGGFLLSPVVSDRDDFASLYERTSGNPASRVIEIHIMAAERFFEDQIRVSFAVMELGR